MNEIKFRGKAIDTGRWIYGYYFKSPLTDENSGVPQGMGWFFLSDGVTRHCISQNGVVFIVDEKTIGQYTGANDKNNKEIYDKDIIGVSKEKCGEVYWDNDDLQWWVRPKGEYACSKLAANELYVEVIGNTIDDTELLK